MSEPCSSSSGNSRLILASLSPSLSPSSPRSSTEFTEGGVAYTTGETLQILNETEMAMIRRVRPITTTLLNSSSTLVSDLGNLTHMIRNLQCLTGIFMDRAKVTLLEEPSHLALDIRLRFLDNLLRHATELSENFSDAITQLQSFFNTNEIWGDFFDEFERLCVPRDFWQMKAHDLLRQMSAPDISDVALASADELFMLHKKWAEHFCRLSPDYRFILIRYWLDGTSSWSPRHQLNVLESLLASRKFADSDGYDNRPATLWFIEEAPFYSHQDSDDESPIAEEGSPFSALGETLPATAEETETLI